VDLTGIRAIGVDEIHWRHGANFLTLVYQIDTTRKRLLWIGQHRRAKTLLRFFRWFEKERTAALTFICSAHVEALSEGRRQESRPRASHLGSLSHCQAHERRDRSRPPGRSALAPPTRTTTPPDEGAVAAPETARRIRRAISAPACGS
jgi:transposase